MFELTLVDHLRLTFGHVIYRHKTHSQIAFWRARWSRRMRAGEAILIAAVAGSAIATAFGRGRAYAIVSAVLAGAALVTLLLDLTLDFGRSAHAHAWCATRLWRIREQYRALMSDLSDGVIDVEAARVRRDALMNELHGIHESAPPADPQAYQAAARAIGPAEESLLGDEEIELLLRGSSQKAGAPEAA